MATVGNFVAAVGEEPMAIDNLRSRRCLPIVWLVPGSKRSALSLS